jgi:hypothetical protein
MAARQQRQQRAFVHWMSVAWNWRNTHPTAACVVTGLWGVVGLIGGIGSLASHSIGAGIFFILIGAALLGLVIYAGYNTRGFHEWKHVVKGTEYVVEGHQLARSIGPFTVSAAVLTTVVYVGLLYLTTLIIGAATSSRR